MARKPAVVLNREALAELDRGFVAGMEGVADRVLDRVVVPDAAPYGEGLIERGGWISYSDGKKVGESTSGVRKPRDMRVRGRGIAVGVGFTFPGRLVETGTVNYPPRPWFAPVVMEVVGDRGAVEGAIRAALGRALAAKGRKLARSVKS